MKAIQVARTGGSEVLKYCKVSKPSLIRDTDVLIQNHFAGVNFIDTYHRLGLYPLPLPFTPGVEGVGVVTQVGSKVDSSLVGKRVIHYGNDTYAEYTCVDWNKVSTIPDDVSSQVALACLTQGLTAHYLVNDSYRLDHRATCVVHAASGGTGQFIVQLAKLKGSRVIGTSSPGKLNIGTCLGAEMVEYDDLLKYLANEVPGGVDVVYDGVGRATFETSLKCLKTHGTCVLFGNASGPVPPFDPLWLAKYGSLFLTRPKLYDFIATKSELEDRLKDLFGYISKGVLKTTIQKVFPLHEAHLAHKMLEKGQTAGKVLLDTRNSS